MTAIGLRFARSPAAALAIRLPSLSPGRLAFLGYLALGGYLAFVLHAYHGDAYSRVANAYYVLFSRDPHLAAIGFVWAPLPSLFELALMPLNVIWPAFAKVALAGVIMSATFMALAVREVDTILRDLRLRRVARLALVAAFALHPMIVYYGALGMGEAPTLFFCLFATRHLVRYVEASSTTSLMGVGVGLAGGYLSRLEALPAAFGVTATIVLVTLLSRSGTRRARLDRAASDVAVALTPVVLVFVGWAIASWVIVGSPLPSFTSEYGNSSQIRLMAAAGLIESELPFVPSAMLAGLRLSALSAPMPLALAIALWLLIWRRDYRVLAIGSALGPLLGAMVMLYTIHAIAPFLRYLIAVVPLGILLVGVAIAPRRRASRSSARAAARSDEGEGRLPRLWTPLARGAGGALSGIVSASTVLDGWLNDFLNWGDEAAARAISAVTAARIAARGAARRGSGWLAILVVAVGHAVAVAGEPLRAAALSSTGSIRGRFARRRQGWTDPDPWLSALRLRLTRLRGAIGTRLRQAESSTTAVTTRGERHPRWRPPKQLTGLAQSALEGSLRTEARLVASLALIGRRGSRMVRLIQRGAGLVGPAAAALASGAHARQVGIFAGKVWRGLARPFSLLSAAALVALAIAGAPIAAAGMLDPTIAVEESTDVPALLGPKAAAPDRPSNELHTYANEQRIAAYLDALDLPRGAVLMDVFIGFSIALQSNRPNQFVITPDRDFKQAIADPATFGVRYLLVPDSAGNGSLDALNRAYPELTYTSGFATLVRTFPALGPDGPTWSLYELARE